MPKTTLIVGIDFGTTHSGVSWAADAGSKHIRLITGWPHPESGNPNNEKVPSSISYKDGKPDRWGYAVEPGDSLQWIKVLLETNPKYAEKVALVHKSNELLQRLNIRADKVVEDYLRLLWQYTEKDIRQHRGPDYASKHDIRVFLTVPALWSAEAKDRVLSAGRAAGLPPNITCISEPEAAALHVLREKVAENDVQVGERFVICDAGGATVDLITYEIVSLRPFAVKEAAIGDGELCGSIYLDIAFEDYVVMLTGKEQYDGLKPSAKRQMIHREFDRVKRRFGTDHNDEDKYSVELKGVKDDLPHGITDGTIVIERSTLETIFDPVYLKIEELIQHQINQVGTGVKAVILVGGFGSNKYLLSRLEQAHKNSQVAVLTAPNAWSAVSQGAVRWGLGQAPDESRSSSDSLPSSQNTQDSDLFATTARLMGSPAITAITARRVRHSYGVQVVEPFDAAKHDASDQEWDSNLKESVVRHIYWLLKRGDTVGTGEIVEVDLPVVRKMHPLQLNVHVLFEVLICELEDPPRQKTPAVQTLCQLQTKLPFYKLLEKLWHPIRTVPYKLGIELGPATLHFVITHKGKRVGDVWAAYSDLSEVL